MRRINLKAIKAQNNIIFAKLTDEAKKVILKLGYGNNIISDYLKLLRINLNWPEVMSLVSSIQTTNDIAALNQLKEDIYQITRLNYDECESEILEAVKLSKNKDLTYLNKAFERFK